MKKKRSIVGALFGSTPRYMTPIPAFSPPTSPWWYSMGPVFQPQAAGAIIHSKKSKPVQSLFGYAYRVANPNKFNILQPASLYAPKGVPIVGINIQAGTMGVITPAVNSDGTWVDDGSLSFME